MDKLADAYFFRALDGNEIAVLRGLTTIRDVRKGEFILRQGQPSDELFIVRSGSVRVLVPIPDDVEVKEASDQTLVVIGPGECFGEFAFVDGKPTSAAVQAAEDGSVYAIRRADLERTLLANDRSAVKIYKALVHILVSRVRNTDIELVMRKALGG